MAKLSKTAVSRGVLALALLSLALFGLWQLPLPALPKVAIQDDASNAGAALAPLPPPLPVKTLADEIAKRQGWAAQAGGAAPAADNKTTATQILGIGQVGHTAVVLVMEKNTVKAYEPGQTLPDGRVIESIKGTRVRFVPKTDAADETAATPLEGKAPSQSQPDTKAPSDQTATEPDPNLFELFPIDKTKLKPPPPIDPNAPAKSS